MSRGISLPPTEVGTCYGWLHMARPRPLREWDASDDAVRLEGCLARLLPFLHRSDVALTGGVAIALHLAESGCALADLDFVARNPSAISPDVTSDFLVSHFHLPQPGYPKFMLQLVDPIHRLKVDFFSDLVGSIARAGEHALGAFAIKLLATEDIFEHQLGMVRKASVEAPIERKYYEHAQLLGRLCGRPVPELPANALCERTQVCDVNYRCERCAV